MGFTAPIIDPEEEGEVTLDNRDVVGTGAFSAEAGIHFSSAGKMSLLGTDVGASPLISEDEWFTTGNVPGVGNGYFIRAQVTSGVTPDGFAVDTWFSLSSG